MPNNNEQDQGSGEVREFRTPTGPINDDLMRVAEANRQAGHAPAVGPRSTVLPPVRPGAGVGPPPSPPAETSSTTPLAPPAPPIASGVTGFSGIDLLGRVVVADNGTLYEITEKEAENLTVFCFNTMVRTQQEHAKTLAETLGLPMKKEGSDGGDEEEVSEMSPAEKDSTLPERQS